jgi:glyoxylase-like metal-dependent hydrolase (beta-lactamase superfamily II)
VVSVWTEVGERVFLRRYAFFDQQIGVIAGDDELLLVDTRSSHLQAEEIRADLRSLSPLPVGVVVNTHHHFDHAFGNHVFRPATIWGHVRCAARMRAVDERAMARIATEEPALADQLRAVVVDPPDRTFEETAAVDVGGRRVELRHLGRGHTDDDIVVLVPDTGVLFAGDLLEQGAVPWFGDAYPLDWPETVSRLLELVRAAVVPGHGDVGDRHFVEEQLAAFLETAELGRRVAHGELALEEAVAIGPWGPGGSREPLERTLAQLRGELD